MSNPAEMFPKESWQDQGTHMQGGPSTVYIPEEFQYKRFSLKQLGFDDKDEQENLLEVNSLDNVLILMSPRSVYLVPSYNRIY